MSDIDRRTFIKAGATGVAGMALGSAFLRSSTLPTVAAQEGPISHAFLVEPGLISQLNSSRDQIVSYAPWGVPTESTALLDRLPARASLSVAEMESWAARQAAECDCESPAATAADNDVLSQFMGFEIAGAPNLMDIAGGLSRAVVSDSALEMDMDFFAPQELTQINRVHLPVIQQPTVVNGAAPLIGAGAQMPTVAAPQRNPNLRFDHTTGMFGWRFRMKGVNNGKVGDCTKTSVRYLTLEILRQNMDGDYISLLKLKIGTYKEKGKEYFVVSTTGTIHVCYKSKQPTWSELFNMMKFLVVATANAAGFEVMPLWLVACIAAILSLALFMPILLLGVGY